MNVESLFIDEGFGSLDPETFRIAMDALERLQMQGRKIGGDFTRGGNDGTDIGTDTDSENRQWPEQGAGSGAKVRMPLHINARR